MHYKLPTGFLHMLKATIAGFNCNGFSLCFFPLSNKEGTTLLQLETTTMFFMYIEENPLWERITIVAL